MTNNKSVNCVVFSERAKLVDFYSHCALSDQEGGLSGNLLTVVSSHSSLATGKLLRMLLCVYMHISFLPV